MRPWLNKIAAFTAIVLILLSTTVSAAITRNEAAKEILKLVNIERKKAHLKPLKLSRELYKPADTRAKEIVKFFSHTRPNGLSFSTVFYGISYNTVGENLAAGQSTPKIAVEQWMNSPGHRANILNKKFRYLGVGYVYDKNTKYKHYWVQHFKG